MVAVTQAQLSQSLAEYFAAVNQQSYAAGREIKRELDGIRATIAVPEIDPVVIGAAVDQAVANKVEPQLSQLTLSQQSSARNLSLALAARRPRRIRMNAKSLAART